MIDDPVQCEHVQDALDVGRRLSDCDRTHVGHSRTEAAVHGPHPLEGAMDDHVEQTRLSEALVATIGRSDTPARISGPI